jgi:hypothetical protein
MDVLLFFRCGDFIVSDERSGVWLRLFGVAILGDSVLVQLVALVQEMVLMFNTDVLLAVVVGDVASSNWGSSPSTLTDMLSWAACGTS